MVRFGRGFMMKKQQMIAKVKHNTIVNLSSFDRGKQFDMIGIGSEQLIDHIE